MRTSMGRPATGAAGVGEFVVLVDGVQLEKRLVGVLNRAVIGRVDEGEIFGLAQTKRFHLEDDAGEIGTVNLGIGEDGAGWKSSSE